MADFDVVWQRIVALQGQTFRQRRGKVFTYVISGGAVVPSTTNRLLSRSQFARAFERIPLRGPGQLQDLQGPSYLFAILTDPRIAMAGALSRHERMAQNTDVRDSQPGRTAPGALDSPGSGGASGSSTAARPSVPRRIVTSADALPRRPCVMSIHVARCW